LFDVLNVKKSFWTISLCPNKGRGSGERGGGRSLYLSELYVLKPVLVPNLFMLMLEWSKSAILSWDFKL